MRVYYFLRKKVPTLVNAICFESESRRLVSTAPTLLVVVFLLLAMVIPAQALIIAPTVNVFGVVTDSLSGQPLAGVSVSITGPFDHYDVITGNDGLYQSGFIICGNDFSATYVTISISHEGYQDYSQTVSVPCYSSYEHNIALSSAGAEPEPVILIPGIMGSWNTAALAGAPGEQWQLDPIFHTYDQLLANLIEHGGYVLGETLFPFPYDWRNNNVINAAALKDKINEVKSITGEDKVDIVAHSMGGLVARFYVESDLYEQDIDQIIFIASPQLGAPKSYLTWEAGYTGIEKKDIVKEWLMQQIAEVNGYGSVFEYVREKPLGSVKDLLPIYSYLFDLPGNTLRIYPNNYPRNERLEFFNQPENLDKLYSSGIEITEIYSDMPNTTITSYDIIPSTEEQAPLWEHGYINGFTKWDRSSGVNMGYGDETVPTVSSSFLDSNREIVYYDVNHSDIVSRASQDVLDVLTGEYVDINVIDQPDNYIIIQVHSPVDLQVISPSGKRLGKDFSSDQAVNEIDGGFYSGFATALEFVTIPNPENGEYRVVIKGTNEGEYSLLTGYASNQAAQILSKGGSILPGQEVEYSLTLSKSGQETDFDLQPQDQTAPLITINSPSSGQYLHSDIIPVDYTVMDDGTGVSYKQAYLDNEEIADPKLDLFEFKLGEYEFKVKAEDMVNNKAEKVVSFEVIANFDSLESDINRLFAEGDIKDKKTKKDLLKRIDRLEKWYNKKYKHKEKRKDDHKRDDDRDEDWKELGHKANDKWLTKLVDKYLNKLEHKGKISPKAKEMLAEQITYIINHL